MTPRERALVGFIESYTEANGGVSPSVDEMRLGIGLASKSGVARLLRSLQDAGVLRRRPGKVRPYELAGSARLATISDADLLAEVDRRGLGDPR